MSEQTHPEGSRRSNREVTRDMAALFMGPQDEPEEQEQPEAEDLVEDEPVEAEADEQEEDIEDGEAVEPEDEAPSFNWEVVVNGETKSITDEEEARALARKGLHYTTEMQALREEQRQWEEQREATTAQLRQTQEQYAGALKNLEQMFAPILGEEPDWNALYSENPEEYAHKRAQWDQIAGIRAEQQRIATEQAEERRKQFQKAAERERDALLAKVPEWTDEGRQKADIEMIREYAHQIGYSDDELGQLWNHRDFLVLRDAARYRKAQQTGQKEVKKAASKTVEPGKSAGTVNQKSRRERQQRERARKTGKVQDVAKSLERLLAS